MRAQHSPIPGHVSRKLKIAVEVAIGDSLLEQIRNVSRVSDFNNAPYFSSRPQSELNRGYYAKQAVTADRQPKEFRVFISIALVNGAGVIHHYEQWGAVSNPSVRARSSVLAFREF
jgi:hypothetical protein